MHIDHILPDKCDIVLVIVISNQIYMYYRYRREIITDDRHK